jgi:hypothetical protein
MTEVSAIARLKIHEGKLEEFKRLAGLDPESWSLFRHEAAARPPRRRPVLRWRRESSGILGAEARGNVPAHVEREHWGRHQGNA